MSEYWTIKELSEYLGIKSSTLYAKVAGHEIPYYRIGRLVRFRKEEIERWLQGLRQATIDSQPQAHQGVKKLASPSSDIDRLVANCIASAKEGRYTTSQRESSPRSRKGGRRNGTL